MATENLVNLEKTTETSPIKDEFLASYSKENVWQFGQKSERNSSIKLSIEDPFYSFLYIHLKYFLKFFLHLISLNGYMIYDETYNASMHKRFGSVEINIC